MNYDYTSKDCNWRRRVWNQLDKRVAVHPKDAVVLYLAGAQNLDLPVAKEKGFEPGNLIAVESDATVAASLRKAGQLTVIGSLTDVMENWPDHTPVHAVIADYCRDFSEADFFAFLRAFCAPAFSAVVFAGNFQRGRCATLNKIRSAAPEFRHRGEIFVAMMAACLPLIEHGPLYALEPTGLLDRSLKGLTANAIFTSYLSPKRAYFDGCIFSPLSNPEAAYRWHIAPNEVKPRHLRRAPPNLDLKRQIAAVLAHHTRRAA